MEIREDVPIYRVAELAADVYSHFGRDFGDLAIRTDIVDAINSAAGGDDLGSMRLFLSDHPTLWLGRLQTAYFMDGDALAAYPAWAGAKCDLILAIARRTREDDGIIQHLLNYEDFHIEVLPFPFGPPFIAELYDLRGLDFFLVHFMGTERDALSDDALFDHAECVGRALDTLGRTREADLARGQLLARRQRLATIGRDYLSPNEAHDGPILERLQVLGERFWHDYLSVLVWQAISRESRSELLDAFSTEFLIQAEVLTNWSTAALILARVIEREVRETLWRPWLGEFADSEFQPTVATSKRQERRIAVREHTLSIMRATAASEKSAPTLGQLALLAVFWSDALMDGCTSVFLRIRSIAEAIDPGHTEKVNRLAALLTEPLAREAPADLTVVRLRNASAHPDPEIEGNWEQFVTWLRDAMGGDPPRQMLQAAIAARIVREAPSTVEAVDSLADKS